LEAKGADTLLTWLKRFSEWIKKKWRGLLGRLGFGEEVVLDVPKFEISLKEGKSGNLKSFLGLWAEYEASWVLNEKLEKNGFAVKSSTEEMRETSTAYFNDNLSELKGIKQHEERIRVAGREYANIMYTHITEAPDSYIFEYVQVTREDKQWFQHHTQPLTLIQLSLVSSIHSFFVYMVCR